MHKLIVTIALGPAVIGTPAPAQAPTSPPPLVAVQQTPLGMMRDQSRAEAQQRADTMFQMIDANHDGTVTRAEADQALAQFQSARGGDDGRGGGRMQRMMDQAFATTQSLTLAQFQAQALARFDAQDLNHDGTVTAAERQQARQQRAQGQYPVPLPPQPQRQ